MTSRELHQHSLPEIRGPDGPPLRFLLQYPRITSYNVCYTKLLRAFLSNVSLRYPSLKKLSLTIFAPFKSAWILMPTSTKGSNPTEERTENRITSYNVCYTKLLRITPSFPETGFGYIEAEGEQVKAFHEKPTIDTAKKYLADGHYRITSYNVCYTKLLRKS